MDQKTFKFVINEIGDESVGIASSCFEVQIQMSTVQNHAMLNLKDEDIQSVLKTALHDIYNLENQDRIYSEAEWEKMQNEERMAEYSQELSYLAKMNKKAQEDYLHENFSADQIEQVRSDLKKYN